MSGYAGVGGFVGPLIRPAQQFTPRSLNGLLGWYDASQISTLWQDSARTTPVTANANPIGAWDDRSGNGNHIVQATAGSRPFYTSSDRTVENDTGVGGKFLAKTGLANAQPLTVFIVMRGSGNAASNVQFSLGAATAPQFFCNTAQAAMAIYAGSTAGSISFSATGLHIVTAVFSGAASTLRLNSAAEAVVSVGTNALAGIALFDDTSGGSNNWIGACAEFIVCASAISAGTQDRVRAYLKAKWGTP